MYMYEYWHTDCLRKDVEREMSRINVKLDVNTFSDQSKLPFQKALDMPSVCRPPVYIKPVPFQKKRAYVICGIFVRNSAAKLAAF